MKRRDFLKSTAAITGGGMIAGYDGLCQSNSGPEAVPGSKPNILFILADELRYPTVFPDDIKSPEEFLARFMPNVHKLWRAGVKFGEYHTAANACTPSRGVMITGLYSQQSCLLTTILSTPYPPAPPPKQPVLNPNYPTFGKLLRKNGYQTPYTGKWHVSIPQAPAGLEDYGFDFFTYYDPTGDNLQGTYGDEIRGYHNDSYSAGQGVDWLLNRRPTDQPWRLTLAWSTRMTGSSSRRGLSSRPLRICSLTRTLTLKAWTKWLIIQGMALMLPGRKMHSSVRPLTNTRTFLQIGKTPLQSVRSRPRKRSLKNSLRASGAASRTTHRRIRPL